MTTEKIVFETGATSAAVNELILYTDNTSKLAEMRNSIYQQHLIGPAPLAIHFIKLLDKVELEYYREFGATKNNRHIHAVTPAQNEEYCQIYANRFPEWKKEKERNP